MITIQHFSERKLQQKKMSIVTCYDYTFARLLNVSPIDAILVGDSAAMVMHGFDTTLPASVDMMCMHTQAVRRGAPDKWIITDLPFLSYRGSLDTSLETVRRCMQAGANAVKLEGIAGNETLIQHLVASGVPVMGHIGLTPQSVHQIGGFRVQGKKQDVAKTLLEDAKRCELAGCFSLVLECVTTKVAEQITKTLTIPTIGIGASAATDGQVLVLHDLLGLQLDFKPKFLKHYLNGAELVLNAIHDFHEEVSSATYPSEEHSYA